MVAQGKVADLPIVNSKKISEVRMVLIGGRQVVQEGKLSY
jgi:adenine deaminase